MQEDINALTPQVSELNHARPERQRSQYARDLGRSAEEELRLLTALRSSITVHNEALDDPDLIMCVAESETSLLEVIDLMLEADMYDDGLIDGLKRQKDTMAVRLHRLQERRSSRRAILEQALLLLEQKTLERPTGTLSLSRRAPNLVVEEEAQIPARFFDLRPVLNRNALKEALAEGEVVAGARLSSGSITLTLRRR